MSDGERDFAQELEQFLDQHDYDTPQVGDIRQGIIVSISQQGVIVDLGLKRDGLVPASDIQKLSEEERESLKVDDEVPVYILGTGDAESLSVSLFRAMVQEDWAKVEALRESGEVVQGEVAGYNKGGLLVPFGRLRGFVPLSHIVGIGRGLDERTKQRRLAKMRGSEIPVKVIEVDRDRRRLVFSNREAQRELNADLRAETMESLHEGQVLKGRVRSIRDFGAFVDIGGIDGLVHVSELAWHRVENPRQVLKVGDEIEVMVLGVDVDRERISLSRKALLGNPWDTVEDRYFDGQLLEGRIVRIVDYGAFVELEPGVEGLLHTSQLGRNVQDVKDMVAEGETHLLRVLSVDGTRQRIRLSLKAVTAQEQIEWMTRQAQQQMEAQAAAEAEAEAAEAEAAEPAAAEPAAAEADAPETGATEADTGAVEAAATETAEAEAAAAEVAEAADTEADEAEADEAEADETEADAAEVVEAVDEAEIAADDESSVADESDSA